eukprot:6491009-Amphidinium_carterae.1
MASTLADGRTIKQQYVTADNGVEHNHNRAMALHRWHRDNHMVLTIQQMAIPANPRQQQWPWNRLAVDKPSDNHALFGDNDSGERGQVVHILLSNEYNDFDTDIVLTLLQFTLHFAQLQQSGGTRQ